MSRTVDLWLSYFDDIIFMTSSIKMETDGAEIILTFAYRSLPASLVQVIQMSFRRVINGRVCTDRLFRSVCALQTLR